MNGESWAPITDVMAEYRVVQESGEPLQSCARGRRGEQIVGLMEKMTAIRIQCSDSIAEYIVENNHFNAYLLCVF
jgi:hypothetical protein